MDQVKVGNYICKKRKELGLTQKDLAEKVEVTDKSISKWERGNGLPDASRLNPLCEALHITINELIAGEDISEAVLSEKTEENIMSLIKENENQKTNTKVVIGLGVALSIVTVCLLGVSLPGSSYQSVGYYLDVVTILAFLLIVGIGILLSKDRTVTGICTMIQKLAIPSGAFIGLFKGILLFAELTDIGNLGNILATILLAPLYGLVLYLISSIAKTYFEK